MEKIYQCKCWIFYLMIQTGRFDLNQSQIRSGRTHCLIRIELYLFITLIPPLPSPPNIPSKNHINNFFFQELVLHLDSDRAAERIPTLTLKILLGEEERSVECAKETCGFILRGLCGRWKCLMPNKSEGPQYRLHPPFSLQKNSRIVRGILWPILCAPKDVQRWEIFRMVQMTRLLWFCAWP